jgi:hypothetical protein
MERSNKMNIASGNKKWVLLIGGILVCAVCAVIATGGNFLRGNPSVPPVVLQQPASDTSSVPINNNDKTMGAVQWGPVVMARTVGEGNVPVDTTKQFSTNEPVIYAVAKATVPANTHIFARWSRDGTPFEDTTEIVSDRAYQNTYIEFHIAPQQGAALAAGNYTVQFFVDGNPGPQAQFRVS